LKVVFVLHSHKLGGAEKHVLILSQLLTKNGHDVIYAGPQDSWLSEQLIKIGVDTFHIPMHGFYDLPSTIKLIFFLNKYKPDIVHGHLTRGAFYSGLVAKYLRIPSVATAHATNTWKHFQRSDRIICVSNAVKNFLASKGYEKSRLKLIYNGVIKPEFDIISRNNLRNEWQIDSDDIVFGMISRIIYEKGHDLALDAFDKIGRKGKLVFVGDYNTEYGSFLKDKVDKMGLKTQVIFVGQQDSVNKYLSAFDIFLSPSRREAMPLSILEALGAGLPVIGSDVGGIPEAIVNGYNGLIFKEQDVDMMAWCMSTLYQNAEMRRSLSKNAIETFNAKFSAEVMFSEVFQLYQQVIVERGKNV